MDFLLLIFTKSVLNAAEFLHVQLIGTYKEDAVGWRVFTTRNIRNMGVLSNAS